jgi:hypothetical protein
VLRKIVRRLSQLRFKHNPRLPVPAMPISWDDDPIPQRRGTQIEFRFRDPDGPEYPYYSPYYTPDWSSRYTPNYTRVAANASRMKGHYTPRRYDGPVVFFASTGGHSLVCDPQAVWPKYLPQTEWIRLPGDHLSMLIGRNVARLAADLADRMRSLAPIR